ncbi:pilus assembly protein TadG-related protein [Paraburkholderia fungorum]|uniref:pilus assembly protein TadG-related protein n=1 Tax=Paraburkholderia fungorum TaxID=134537 RepID=UPI0009430CFE|nr:pilus assembly protein TadG-related protein [Paraburkholderia fungorum]
MNAQPSTPAHHSGHARPADPPGSVRRPRLRRVGGARRQHGAVAIVAVMFLVVALAALAAIDVGNVFFVRRQLQRTADLAALAAVQVVSTPNGCATTVSTTARANATANGFTAAGTTKTLQAVCGRWTPGAAATAFNKSGTPANAVSVNVSQYVPYLFLVGKGQTVTASSVAVASNVAVFSLGTGIATLNTQQSVLLNAILGGLLHSNVALSVGDTQSLAAANINLAGLMTALNAGSMQGLLATSVSYQKLVVAMVKALQSGGDTIDAAILQTLAVTVPGGQNINLGYNSSTSTGLLALGLANPDSAATATINVLDTVLAAAQIAQSNSSGTAPVINVAAGLTGVAGMSMQMINPPVLAVGEAGLTPPVTARTSAIKVTLTLAALPSVNLGLASVALLNTPLMVTLYVAPGTAQLSNVDCENTKAATTVTFKVTPGLAGLCLGGVTNCTPGSVVPPVNVASVTLLGANVLNVSLAGLGPAQLSPGSTDVSINGSSGSFNVVAQPVNSNALGSDLSSLTSILLGQLSNPNALTLQVLGSNLLGDLLSSVISLVSTTLSPLLQSIFGLLNAVVGPVLTLLGVQIGTATVHNMSLTCGVPQLVQ